MIIELGHFSLILGWIVSLVQGIAPSLGVYRGDGRWMAIAKPAALLQFFLILAAFLSLTYGYIVSDFSVANVAANSHSEKPLVYKISGVWGNHEGSMLLWCLILALFGALCATQKTIPSRLQIQALIVQGWLGAGFIAFLLFTSNPFLRLDIPPINGNGLNPLLQDPGLALHPPFLYLGYVGYSMTFSLTLAALLDKRIDSVWVYCVRPWALASWIFLTVGIALGSWWAYYTLGWGGWWFWDPVENASLMPWLSGTALLHSLAVVEKRDSLKAWCVLLAIATFALSLIGTFLVRSGILTSVHTFAVDPERGIGILLLLSLFVGVSLVLYMIQAPLLRDSGLFKPLSREGALILNNLVLATVTGLVFVGTLYPLLLDLIASEQVSVGPPYFNMTILPLMAVIAFSMSFAIKLRWKKNDLSVLLPKLIAVFLLTVLAILCLFGLFLPLSLLALGGITLAIWVIVGVAVDFAERIALFRVPFSLSLKKIRSLPRSTAGMMVAHIGFGVLIFGITATSLWVSQTILALSPGQTTAFQNYRVLFHDAITLDGPNYIADQAHLEFSTPAGHTFSLKPERRYFIVSDQTISNSDILMTPQFSLMATLGDQDGKGQWTLRLYYHPFLIWIWIGGLIMACGALISLNRSPKLR